MFHQLFTACQRYKFFLKDVRLRLGIAKVLRLFCSALGLLEHFLQDVQRHLGIAKCFAYFALLSVCSNILKQITTIFPRRNPITFHNFLHLLITSK